MQLPCRFMLCTGTACMACCARWAARAATWEVQRPSRQFHYIAGNWPAAGVTNSFGLPGCMVSRRWRAAAAEGASAPATMRRPPMCCCSAAHGRFPLRLQAVLDPTNTMA